MDIKHQLIQHILLGIKEVTGNQGGNWEKDGKRWTVPADSCSAIIAAALQGLNGDYKNEFEKISEHADVLI